MCFSDKNKRLKSLFLSSCLFLLTAGLISPWAAYADYISGNAPIRKVLPNGMVMILLENHAAPVVSIQVFVKTGSIHETETEAGIAHVHEHMLFKGTTTRGVGEIARTVEAAGGEINAYTSWERTVYYVNMASRFMDTGIDIMIDIITQATFDPEELDKELEVILEELRRSRDLPARRLSETFFAQAYTKHPYRRPVIGFENTIRSFTREDVMGFYKKWYVPENMVWVMAGDFDAAKVLSSLTRRLSTLENHPLPAFSKIVEPPQTAPRVFINKEEIKEALFKTGFHIPEFTHPDIPALDLLAQIMGQGRSSRLYDTLRMKNRLVNTIYAYAMTPLDPGLFIIDAGMEAKDIGKALPVIFQEIFRTAFEPVTTDELRKAKTQIESDFIHQKETMSGQARELGYYEVSSGDLEFGRKYLDRLRKVQIKDLLNVAERYLHPDNMTLGLHIPAEDSSNLSQKKILKMVTKTYKNMKSKKPQREPDQTSEVLEHRLSNGIRLLIKENHAVPLVSMRAVLLGGLLSETPENNGICNFMASMLTKGTARRSAEQIAQEVESLAGSVSGFSGRDSFGLTAETVSGNFQLVFDVFADILLSPAFPEDFIEKTRKDILAAIKNKEDDLAGLAFEQFWRNTHPCHPYGMDPLGTKETIERLSRKDLQDYYRNRAVAENIVMSIVGDVDGQEVINIAENHLKNIPDNPFLLPVHTCDNPPKPKRVFKVSPDKQQAHIIIGAKGACHTDPDKYTLDVLDAILSGQGGRLFVHLRDHESLAYTVSSFSRQAVEPGLFGVYLATQPGKMATAIKKTRGQLQRIREENVSEKELTRAKNYLIGTYEIGLQTNSAQAAALAFNERYGLGYREYEQYPKHISAVTAKQVRKAADKYLCPDCLIETIVLPEEGH